MQTDAHADRPHKIVPLERGDLQAQAALCSQAFWSDPLYNFLYRTCVVFSGTRDAYCMSVSLCAVGDFFDDAVVDTCITSLCRDTMHIGTHMIAHATPMVTETHKRKCSCP